MKVTPIFSVEDHDLTDTRWNVSPASCPRKWYPKRSTYNGSSRKPIIEYAHRLVVERKIGRKLMPGEICDHVDNNKLDNRRENLRVTNTLGNAQNRNFGPWRGAVRKSSGRWQASVNSKQIPVARRYIGMFNSRDDAAKAASELRREFGMLEGAV